MYVWHSSQIGALFVPVSELVVAIVAEQESRDLFSVTLGFLFYHVHLVLGLFLVTENLIISLTCSYHVPVLFIKEVFDSTSDLLYTFG